MTKRSTILTVTARPLGKIKPYWRNPRKISDKVVKKVAASLRQHGWQQPIVVDRDGIIIVGHVRHEAACLIADSSQRIKDWPDAWKAPVTVATLTKAQAKAYRLDDNRSGEEARWDLPRLSEEMTELKDLKFDLGTLSFDAEEIADLTGPKEPTDPIRRGHHEYRCPSCAYEWTGSPKPEAGE